MQNATGRKGDGISFESVLLWILKEEGFRGLWGIASHLVMLATVEEELWKAIPLYRVEPESEAGKCAYNGLEFSGVACMEVENYPWDTKGRNLCSETKR